MPLERGIKETQIATECLTLSTNILTSGYLPLKHLKFFSCQIDQMTAENETFHIFLFLLNPTPNLQNSNKDEREWGTGVET